MALIKETVSNDAQLYIGIEPLLADLSKHQRPDQLDFC
jgi:hypothetical protein